MESRLVVLPLVLAGLLAACVGGPDSVPENRVAENARVRNRGADKDNWWNQLPRPEWAAFERIEQEENWFEVYRVADGVFAIYEPGQFEEVISFLIEGSERALLFDAGLGIGDMRRVVEGLTDLEVIVLNSHTHYDHIGGNYQFETVYARDTDYTRQRAAGSSTEAVAGFLEDGWIWKPLPEGFDPGAFRSRPFEVSRWVGEGDVIDLGGRRLEVLVTPGHAPDAICLLDRSNRMLWTGDTFYLAPLYTHLEGSNFEAYARTATRLAGLASHVDSVLTAHNVPIVESRYLKALGAAFDAIRSGTLDYTLADGVREYPFEGFSVMVRPEDAP